MQLDCAAILFRDRLIDLRSERNLTQQEMADAIGVHVNQIRRYESGATQPSLNVLKKISDQSACDH